MEWIIGFIVGATSSLIAGLISQLYSLIKAYYLKPISRFSSVKIKRKYDDVEIVVELDKLDSRKLNELIGLLEGVQNERQ